MKLTTEQIVALEFSASDGGAWPRAKANARSRVIRTYRALERRGLILEVKGKEITVRGETRINFVATDAGRNALDKERGE